MIYESYLLELKTTFLLIVEISCLSLEKTTLCLLVLLVTLKSKLPLFTQDRGGHRVVKVDNAHIQSLQCSGHEYNLWLVLVSVFGSCSPCES